MAFDNAQKFTALGMAYPLAKEVGAAIDNATDDNPAIAALAPVTTPDATDPASVITLSNANKAKINAIIAALQA